MTAVRQAHVAGSFYPADPAELTAMVGRLLGEGDSELPSALIVPHAAYACSGPVAGSAYRLLGDSFRTVLLLGPGHFRDPRGSAVPESSAWRTPLGEVPIDQDLCGRLVDRGLAHRDDRPHAGEHSLEVQLPFLQRVLSDGWSCVPVVARSTPADEVADLIDAVSGDGVLVVVSSDLSHYHDQLTAQRLDVRTAGAIVDAEVEAVRDGDACGAVVVRGLLAWTRRHDLGVELLDLRTSADTCGDPSRVVGYGAFVVR